MQATYRLVGDTFEDVGEPGLRVEVVELGGADQRVHGRGTVTAPVRAADSDETGRAFQSEAGHLFRAEAGLRSDLKPATWAAAPGSMVMVDAIAPTVKPAWSAGLLSAACAGSRP